MLYESKRQKSISDDNPWLTGRLCLQVFWAILGVIFVVSVYFGIFWYSVNFIENSKLLEYSTKFGHILTQTITQTHFNNILTEYLTQTLLY